VYPGIEIESDFSSTGYNPSEKARLLLMEDKPNIQLSLRRFHILFRLFYERRIR